MLASLLLLIGAASAFPLIERATPPYIFSGDAPYNVDTANLSSTLTCPYGMTSSSKPVLLVHGTGSTGAESWADSYVPALKANGYTACYVTLPKRSMGDMQITAGYVAYNIHAVSVMAGNKKVAVIGHSQGNPNIQWALRFWPSAQSLTSMFIALAPDFTGVLFSGITSLCDIIAGVELCAPSLWQQAAGSQFYNALHYKGYKALVPTTSIYTLEDEVVIPSVITSALPGAVVIPIQQICPLRIRGHLLMVIDNIGFQLALDALSHNGVASVSRISPLQCFLDYAPHMNPTVPLILESAINDVVLGVLLTVPKAKSEPVILPYAIIANQ